MNSEIFGSSIPTSWERSFFYIRVVDLMERDGCPVRTFFDRSSARPNGHVPARFIEGDLSDGEAVELC